MLASALFHFVISDLFNVFSQSRRLKETNVTRDLPKLR